MTVSVGLDGGDQPELEDETVVVGRQFAVQTVVEGVGCQLALEQGSCALSPLGRPGVPRKGTCGDKPSCRLGHDVVVGR